MLDSAYFILLFFIAFIEIVRKKSDKFDFLTLFNIYFSLLYVLPGFLLAFDFKNSVADIGLGISLYTNNIQTAFAIFGGYFLVFIGFYTKTAQSWGKSIVIKARNNDLIVLIYAILLLVFSCISIYMYGLQYGGFLNALANTTLIRAQVILGGQLVFFKHFTLFSLFASYLLGSFVFISKVQKKNILTVFFLISVFAAFTAVSLIGGRGYLINYFLVFYLVYLLKSRNISWELLLIFVCFAGFFLFYGKSFFFSLSALPNGFDAVLDTFIYSIENGSSNEFSFYTFMGNFHYPVYSLDVALSKNYQLRWFVDLLYGFISLLPDRLLGTPAPESILYFNTRYIIGNNAFAIPTGFLAFGIYSMWWPGLIIVSFTYGWLGRYLQTILYKHVHDKFWMPFLYAAVAQMWMDLMSSDPETFFQSYFALLIAVLLLLAIGSKVSVVVNSKS